MRRQAGFKIIFSLSMYSYNGQTILGKKTADLTTLLRFLEGNVDSRLKQDLAEQSIDKVDYVVCNLYPFKVRNDFSMYYVPSWRR